MSVVQTYPIVSFNIKTSEQSTVLCTKLSDGSIVIGGYKRAGNLKISVGSVGDFNKTMSAKKAIQMAETKVDLMKCVSYDRYCVVIDGEGGLYGAIELGI